MIGNFRIYRSTGFRIITEADADSAVKMAAEELSRDLWKVTGAAEDNSSRSEIFIYTAGTGELPEFMRGILPSDETGAYRKEGYALAVRGGKLYIAGADRRGTVYGIYELSKMAGVSPWYWWADVPVKKIERLVLKNGLVIADHPSIEYRGIFINDEEELENWVKAHMGEDTIGTLTYRRVFELLLRLRANYIWPAMHVNSFNVKRENGELADRMGIIVGTSHCDMLMRSNNHEWNAWLKETGLQGTEYDYSIDGQNRENIDRYWRESVEQNRDFEVSWTLGMRGIHDWGMAASEIDRTCSGKSERLEKRKLLLEGIIRKQRELISGYAPENKGIQIFIPYKEVLELYNAGLEVPEDVTIVRVNDNFGYVRSYPDAEERKRSGGHGLYYHTSYWGAPGMDYLFISSLPHAHMKYELDKAYENGIKKLWVLNAGAIKPLEQDIEFFLDRAWEMGRKSADTDDVMGYIEKRINRDFSGSHGAECSRILTDFAQITNVRKLEHMKEDAFSLDAYGDEWSDRINRLRACYDIGNRIYSSLPENEKAAFFQLILMKIHASYYINSEYYYADRSRKSFAEGKLRAAVECTERSAFFDGAKRRMLEYYNNVMSGGKWSGILTPELYPPPVYAMHPLCSRCIVTGSPRLIVSAEGGAEDGTIHIYGNERKWIDIANGGSGRIGYYVCCSEGVGISSYSGVAESEVRLEVWMEEECVNGTVSICGSDGSETEYRMVHHDAGFGVCEEKDGRIVINASDIEGGRTIEYAGRYEGALRELTNCGDSARAEIYLKTPGRHMIELHRFPSIAPGGRIFARIAADGAEVTAGSEAVDEWRGAWRENVMDNADRVTVELPYMEAGVHTIEITAGSRYFAFSRAVIYTGAYRKNNLGIEPRSNALPVFDGCIPIYGELELKPRPQIYTRCRDWSGDRLCGTNIRIMSSEWAKPCAVSEYGSCRERNGDILIDAACAFANDERAYTENGGWLCCSGTSYGETGMAAYTEPDGEVFISEVNAPKLNYNISVDSSGKYTMWILTKINEESFQSIIVGVDGEFQPASEQFMQGNIWSYEAKQIWRWIPFTELYLENGVRTLSIALQRPGMRIDRIFLTQTDELPPTDQNWG